MLNAKLQPLRTRRAALPQLSIIQQPSAVLQHLSADAGAAISDRAAGRGLSILLEIGIDTGGRNVNILKLSRASGGIGRLARFRF